MKQHLTTRDAARAAISLITFLEIAEEDEWDDFYYETIEEIGVHDLVAVLVGLSSGLLDLLPEGQGEEFLRLIAANVTTLPATPLPEPEDDPC